MMRLLSLNIKTCLSKILFVILLHAFFYLQTPLAESSTLTSSERGTIIEQTLNCFSQQASASAPEITWEDICYSDNYEGYQTQNEEKRQRSVTKALDRLEQRIENYVTEHYPGVDLESDFDEYGAYLGEGSNPYEFEAEPLIMAAPTDSSIDMRYQKRDELTKEKVIEAELALMSGYRQDELSWNIAGNIAGEDPNILVQYDWTGLHIYQIKGKGRVIFNEAFVIDGEAARGEALAGDVRVSEYDADNKRSEATRVTADAEGSSTMDFSLGFGYQFKLNKLSKIDDAVEFDEETNLTLLAGYSYHEQDLNIREGVQVLDTGSPPSLGPFPGLDSPYKTEWQGPWIGVEVNGEREKIDGRIRFEYHFPEYYAEGRSNLQPAFQQPKSFEHEADGTGMVLAANFDYNINEDWKIDLAADAQMWNATEGVDRLFLLNGQQPETRLNDVDWESFSVMLGATYKFE